MRRQPEISDVITRSNTREEIDIAIHKINKEFSSGIFASRGCLESSLKVLSKN
jgi:hypothetical protein